MSNGYTTKRLTDEDLGTIAEVLRVTIDDPHYAAWRPRLGEVRERLTERLGDLPQCACDQEGDYCPEHPPCACGCQRHAHRGGPCIAGKMTCHGCEGYRPARSTRFDELCDDDLEHVTLVELRRAYRDLRAHHVEETTALREKLVTPRA